MLLMVLPISALVQILPVHATLRECFLRYSLTQFFGSVDAGCTGWAECDRVSAALPRQGQPLG